jgi:hypothetical protein
MTVRQVYYQLVSRQVIENSRSSYQSVSKALVAARREADPWEYIEDRLVDRAVSMWSGSPTSPKRGDKLSARRVGSQPVHIGPGSRMRSNIRRRA